MKWCLYFMHLPDGENWMLRCWEDAWRECYWYQAKEMYKRWNHFLNLIQNFDVHCCMNRNIYMRPSTIFSIFVSKRSWWFFMHLKEWIWFVQTLIQLWLLSTSTAIKHDSTTLFLAVCCAQQPQELTCPCTSDINHKSWSTKYKQLKKSRRQTHSIRNLSSLLLPPNRCIRCFSGAEKFRENA